MMNRKQSSGADQKEGSLEPDRVHNIRPPGHTKEALAKLIKFTQANKVNHPA